MEYFGIEVTGVRRRRRKGGGPFLAGAAVHLNFMAQKYYWNGAARTSADFTTFTGGTLDSTGLVLDGSGSHDINILTATLGISLPAVLIASFTPASVTGAQFAASIDIDGANACAVGLSGTSRIVFVFTGSVTQANFGAVTAVIGTRTVVGGNFETNNILCSVDGLTGGAADTSATLFTATKLRIGEQSVSNSPINGTIHHVLVFSGAKTQTELNDLTARVSTLR